MIIEDIKQKMCDDYCKMPQETCSQEELDEYCKTCPLNMLETISNEPEQVIYSGDGYSDGELVYDMAQCPNCGQSYEDGDAVWGCDYCPDCGQALKWEV